MSIHELYGRLAEQQAATEVNRRFLYDLVLKLKSGEVTLDQIAELPDGGFELDSLEEKCNASTNA